MAKKCSNPQCLHINADSSHYCVKCGNPLEKKWRIFPVNYIVVDKDKYDALTKERDNLRRQINNSWGIKIENWIKENKETILWISASIFAIIFISWIFIKCTPSHKETEVIVIQKDDTSGKFGIYNNESKTLVIPYEYDSISHRKGCDYYQGDWNFFYLHKNGKLGIADSLGKMTIGCELDATRGLYNGIMVLIKDGKQGLMDSYGHQILPTEYQYVLWEKQPQYSSFERPGTYAGNIIPVKG